MATLPLVVAALVALVILAVSNFSCREQMKKTRAEEPPLCGLQAAAVPKNDTERAMLAKLQSKYAAVVDIMEKTHPRHRYTQRIRDNVKFISIVDPARNEIFAHYRMDLKCIAIRIMDDHRPAKGYQTNQGRLNALLIHELAHVAAHDLDEGGDTHGLTFQSAHSFLLRLLTSPPHNWPVDLLVCHTCEAHGLCNKAACPRCNYLVYQDKKWVRNDSDDLFKKQKCFYLPVGGTECDEKNTWRKPENKKEEDIVRILRDRMREFANHLKNKYPRDPRTVHLLKKWNGNVNLSSRTDHGASFSLRKGCMVVNPYSETNSKDPKKRAELKKLPTTPGSIKGMDDLGRLLTRVLHELAHSSGNGHDKVFYDAQRFFLRVATEQLGWTLLTSCRVCCDATNPCNQVCPKCTWTEGPDDCAPREKECRPKGK